MAKVLIVDDEKSVRATLSAFLAEEGHEVVLAADVAAAAAPLRDGMVDVVLVDIGLPGTTGIALLERLSQERPALPVIMMTGEPSAATAAAAVRAGAVDYLFKPIGRAAVLRSVQIAVRIHRLSREKLELEETNRRYRETLERLVEERTRALSESNDRLQKALVELKGTQRQIIQTERLSALGQMASGIAHDFNNLLMPILGFADLLLDRPERMRDPAKVREAMETIRSAASDARETVRRLREFYRERDDLPQLPLSLPEQVRQVIRLTEPAYRGQAQAKGIDIRVLSEIEDVDEVLGDEAALREAMTNLLLNAVDAVPTGGVITVRVFQDPRNVSFEVVDDGVGMSEEVLRRCCEPFFTTKGEHGTGLGLSMVHGIVLRHDGRVTIASTPGVGTRVRVDLPRPRRDARPESVPAVPAAAIAPLRILIVDDDRIVRSLLARYLEEDGHQVEAADGGAAGIARFGARPFDLVITDRAMPGAAGDQLAVEIKQASPTTPVIMLTGFGDAMKWRAEQPPGVDLVVSKPITLAELRAAIASVIPYPPKEPR